MNFARVTLLSTLALVVGGCGPSSDEPGVPAEGSTVLRSQTDDMSRTSTRISTILNRPWSTSFPSVSRLRTRLAAAQAFIEEAAASATDPTKIDALVRKGRELVVAPDMPVSRALAAFEYMAHRLDRGTLLDEQLPQAANDAEALGGRGVKLRSDAWRDGWRFAKERLEAAITATLAATADAAAQDARIADGMMERAVADGERLLGEIKAAVVAARDARYRETLIQKRVVWARDVAKRAGEKLPPEARAALEAASGYADAGLKTDVDAAVAAVFSGNPDARTRIDALSKTVDGHVTALMERYLALGRSLGLPDPE